MTMPFCIHTLILFPFFISSSFLKGTNVFPTASSDTFQNYVKLDTLDPSVDTVEQRYVIKKIQEKNAPYAMRVCGTIRWVLDEHNDKISEFWSDFKFSVVKPEAGVKL